MSAKIVVVKVGGAVLHLPEFPAHLARELKHLQESGWSPVVVHGGGPAADALLRDLRIPVRKWKGRRITDDATLRVAKMAYRGLVQADLVAGLFAHGVRALGMCGSDGWLIAHKRAPVPDPEAPEPVDFGWVGDIVRVDPAPLIAILSSGFVPVIASLATDAHGGTLNVNADTIAERIAVTLRARELIYLTDVPGILRDGNSLGHVISRLSVNEFRHLRETGVLTDGMLPKADAIENALNGGILRVRVAHGLANFATARPDSESPVGTLMTPDRNPSVDARDPVSVLQHLIAIPSVSGSEDDIADALEEILRNAGAKVVRIGNSVVAIRGHAPPTLLLNAHTDTVPPAHGWTTHPFEPTADSGRIYGLGAVDCKGPLSALLCAFLGWNGSDRPGRLVFTATPEEETGGKDLSRICDELGTVDGVVIAEPTALRPCIAQKGLLRVDIELSGKAGHASRPWQGENAIAKAGDALSALRALSFDIQHPLAGSVTLTPTKIRGGDLTNRIPEKCVISLDIRYPPGIHASEIIAELSRRIEGHIRVISDRIRPLETPADSRLMTALRRAFRASDSAGMFGASNWALVEHIPGVVIGPGNPECSHSANEFIEVTDLVRGVHFYLRLCEAFFNGT